MIYDMIYALIYDMVWYLVNNHKSYNYSEIWSRVEEIEQIFSDRNWCSIKMFIYSL